MDCAAKMHFHFSLQDLADFGWYLTSIMRIDAL